MLSAMISTLSKLTATFLGCVQRWLRGAALTLWGRLSCWWSSRGKCRGRVLSSESKV